MHRLYTNCTAASLWKLFFFHMSYEFVNLKTFLELSIDMCVNGFTRGCMECDTPKIVIPFGNFCNIVPYLINYAIFFIPFGKYCKAFVVFSKL